MKILIVFSLILSAITMNAQQSIAGTWNTGNENTKIEITKTNGIYNGKTVSSDNPEVKIGKVFLKNVKSSGDKWKGKVYSPKKDTWYNAVLEEKNGQLLVTIKSGWVSKTLKWKQG